MGLYSMILGPPLNQEISDTTSEKRVTTDSIRGGQPAAATSFKEIWVSLLIPFIYFLSKIFSTAEFDSMYTSGDGDTRRLIDGTNPKELVKAMSTFMNEVGPGDYDLPILTGEKAVNSK